MVSITTRQRDLLHILLQSKTPLVAAEIAERLRLTPRQVSYGLRGMQSWLTQRGITIQVTSGVGVSLVGSAKQRLALAAELEAKPNFQLVLVADERHQLLALQLLTSQTPFILLQLQQSNQVSRTTILKDLDTVGTWFEAFGLQINRRQNHGVWLAGSEDGQRKALAALLWGNHPFGNPLMTMTHADGLVFRLAADADYLAAVHYATEVLPQWNVQRALGQVAYAETQLGGRFADDTVLHLSLVLAIQVQRVQQGRYLAENQDRVQWLSAMVVWSVAERICRRLLGGKTAVCPDPEIATIAINLLAGARNGRWPGDLEIDTTFADLMTALMHHTATTYGLPLLKEDGALRDGIISHIIPACLRQRFAVWTPPPAHQTQLAQQYAVEKQIAQELADIVQQHTTITLPAIEVNNIALLLRAAYIREKPNQLHQVIVVCPSGMATAQLLVARLKARFPQLGTLTVLSPREINATHLDAAQLLITTVPLAEEISRSIDVIQVHPLLLPEDVETITRWLA
ncbi:MAG: PRD domain-containing protein [Chloroflexota bacterium]